MQPKRVTIIAEAGINHGGKLAKAMTLAQMAKVVEADVVKFQTYNTEKLLRPTDPNFATMQRHELSWKAWKELARECAAIGIEFLTTPGDLDSLKFAVEELGVKRIKIGSDDLTNTALIQAAHKTKLPLIISTGMATGQEIADAIQHIDNFVLLHCVSLYPCSPRVVNLRSIRYLANTFACPVGYSDHTANPRVVNTAVAAGAEMIEVHFKNTANDTTIDDAVSFTSRALRLLIQEIRETEAMLGFYGKKPTLDEEEAAINLRKGPDGLRGPVNELDSIDTR